MKAWMLSVLAILPGRFGSNQNLARSEQSGSRRARLTPRAKREWAANWVRCDVLEGRALLATSGVAAFATLPGTVTAANRSAQVTLQLGPGQIQSDRSASVIVGFSVQAADGSTVNPRIVRVAGLGGQATPLNIASHGETSADRLARQTHRFDRVVPLTSQAQTLTIDVASQNKKIGGFIVDAFLAGDANGDGTVDANDLAAVQSAYGSRLGQANYNAAADFNGDGRVGCIDRSLTTLNQGAHLPAPATTTLPAPTSITPTSSSLVDLTQPTTSSTSSTPLAITSPVAVAVATPAAVATTSFAASQVDLTAGSNAITVSNLSAPTVAATSVYPVNSNATTLSSTSALPAGISTGQPLVLVPVSSLSGVSSANGLSTTTPVYVLAQPATSTGMAATPVYVYGQPVVGGTSSAPPIVPSAYLNR